jgi:hypothetical protein
MITTEYFFVNEVYNVNNLQQVSVKIISLQIILMPAESAAIACLLRSDDILCNRSL